MGSDPLLAWSTASSAVHSSPAHSCSTWMMNRKSGSLIVFSAMARSSLGGARARGCVGKVRAPQKLGGAACARALAHAVAPHEPVLHAVGQLQSAGADELVLAPKQGDAPHADVAAPGLVQGRVPPCLPATAA